MQTLLFHVAQPHYPLPFDPQGLAITDDAALALCWSSRLTDEAPRRVSDEAREPDITRILLLDLSSGKIVSQKVLPYRVGSAAVDQHHVYVSPTNTARIEALSHRDLSRQKQAFLDSPVIHLKSLAGKFLFAQTADPAERLFTDAWFSLPDLKRVQTLSAKPDDELSRPRVFGGKMSPRLPYARLHDGWLQDGIVYDAEFKEARLIATPQGFRSVSSEPSPLSAIGPWRVETEPADPHRRGWGPADDPTAVLEDAPIRLVLSASERREVMGDVERAIWTVELKTLDLLGSPQSSTIRLAQYEDYRHWRGGERSYPRLAAAGKTAVAVHDDRLFPHTFEKVDREAFPVPLRFKLAQSLKVVPLDGESQLKHELLGGQGPYESALITQRAEFSLDPKTATITVDGPALAKAAEKALLEQWLKRPLRRSQDKDEPSAAEELAAYVAGTRAAFENIAGRAPAGVPVLVPVGLRGLDSQSQTAQLHYYVFAELPRKGLEEKLAAGRESRLAKHREVEAQELEKEGRKKASPSTPADAAAIRELRAQVGDLEKRLERLEGKLDLLTRLLSKKLDELDEKRK